VVLTHPAWIGEHSVRIPLVSQRNQAVNRTCPKQIYPTSVLILLYCQLTHVHSMNTTHTKNEVSQQHEHTKAIELVLNSHISHTHTQMRASSTLGHDAAIRAKAG